MRKLFFFVFGIFMSIVLQAQGSPPTKGIFVLPAIVDFNLTSGQVGNKTVTVYNRTDGPLQFNVYMSDWERDSLGRHNYLVPNSKSTSCTRWVTLDKTFLEIPSGGAVPINLTLRLPDSSDAIKEMKWSLLFVELINEKKVVADTGVSSQLLQILRLGVHIYQTPPNLTKKEIKMLSFDRVVSITDSLVYRIVTENMGDVQVRCKSSVELTNLTTGIKTKLGPDSYPMFPGQKRIVDYRIPTTLPKGKYSVLAIVDGGEDIPLEAAQMEIEIK